jgi:hypothetical protein
MDRGFGVTDRETRIRRTWIVRLTSSNPITSSGSVLTVESSGSSRPTELIGVTGDQLGLFGWQSIRLGDRRRCQAQRDRVKASETDRALNLVMVLRPPCQGAAYATESIIATLRG